MWIDFKGLFSYLSAGEDNDWKFLIEVSIRDEAKIEKLLEIFKESEIEINTMEETKPIWEPLPHSTIKIYVKKQSFEEAKKLINQNLISESDIVKKTNE
jgi:hypothetical protein